MESADLDELARGVLVERAKHLQLRGHREASKASSASARMASSWASVSSWWRQSFLGTTVTRAVSAAWSVSGKGAFSGSPPAGEQQT